MSLVKKFAPKVSVEFLVNLFHQGRPLMSPASDASSVSSATISKPSTGMAFSKRHMKHGVPPNNEIQGPS